MDHIETKSASVALLICMGVVGWCEKIEMARWLGAANEYRTIAHARIISVTSEAATIQPSYFRDKW